MLLSLQTEAKAGFDIRISPDFPMEEMLELLDKWAEDAGEGVSWENVPGYKVSFWCVPFCQITIDSFFFFFFFFFWKHYSM